jgi:hypothetical protein
MKGTERSFVPFVVRRKEPSKRCEARKREVHENKDEVNHFLLRNRICTPLVDWLSDLYYV